MRRTGKGYFTGVARAARARSSRSTPHSYKSVICFVIRMLALTSTIAINTSQKYDSHGLRGKAGVLVHIATMLIAAAKPSKADPIAIVAGMARIAGSGGSGSSISFSEYVRTAPSPVAHAS
jgi:hypothetical protein